MNIIEKILEELKQLERKRTAGASAPITIGDMIAICERVQKKEEFERQLNYEDVI
jgi:hypothetical protein